MSNPEKKKDMGFVPPPPPINEGDLIKGFVPPEPKPSPPEPKPVEQDILNSNKKLSK